MLRMSISTTTRRNQNQKPNPENHTTAQMHHTHSILPEDLPSLLPEPYLETLLQPDFTRERPSARRSKEPL